MEVIVEPSDTQSLDDQREEAKRRGARLWAAMVEAGLNYSQLSRHTGVNETTIWRLRHGLTLHPQANTIDKLAAGCNVNSLWLMDGFVIDVPARRKK